MKFWPMQVSLFLLGFMAIVGMNQDLVHGQTNTERKPALESPEVERKPAIAEKTIYRAPASLDDEEKAKDKGKKKVDKTKVKEEEKPGILDRITSTLSSARDTVSGFFSIRRKKKLDRYHELSKEIVNENETFKKEMERLKREAAEGNSEVVINDKKVKFPYNIAAIALKEVLKSKDGNEEIAKKLTDIAAKKQDMKRTQESSKVVIGGKELTSSQSLIVEAFIHNISSDKELAKVIEGEKEEKPAVVVEEATVEEKEKKEAKTKSSDDDEDEEKDKEKRTRSYYGFYDCIHCVQGYYKKFSMAEHFGMSDPHMTSLVNGMEIAMTMQNQMMNQMMMMGRSLPYWMSGRRTQSMRDLYLNATDGITVDDLFSSDDFGDRFLTRRERGWGTDRINEHFNSLSREERMRFDAFRAERDTIRDLENEIAFLRDERRYSDDWRFRGSERRGDWRPLRQDSGTFQDVRMRQRVRVDMGDTGFNL
jgi:hypothetical protein